MAKVETLFKSSANLADGPWWVPSSQVLLYVDIINGNAHKYDTATKTEDIAHMGDVCSFVIPRLASNMVVFGDGVNIKEVEWPFPCTKNSLGHHTDVSSKARILHTVKTGPEAKHFRMNDAKCDRRGRLITGTYHMDMLNLETEDFSEKKHAGAALYMMDGCNTSRGPEDHPPTDPTKGVLKTVTDDVYLSNGVTWSLDDRYMYYADSILNLIYAFDYDSAIGTATNKRELIDYRKLQPGEKWGFVDGITSDVFGRIWIANYMGSCVTVHDPERPDVIVERVAIPAQRVTSCCFGGPHFNELYVTTSRHGLDAATLAADPNAACIFKVSDFKFSGARAFPADFMF